MHSKESKGIKFFFDVNLHYSIDPSMISPQSLQKDIVTFMLQSQFNGIIISSKP